MTTGPVALVGGAEWTDGCDFDRDLLELSGGTEVAVLPTAAAYEHPERAVEVATAWFRSLGATVRPVMVLGRADAESDELAKVVRDSRLLYLGGGSPLHLRSVLKDSPVWHALEATWHEGAVIAGSSAGAMALCDPMVDPRGGAFTLGLGLLESLAVIPHFDSWSPEKTHRTIALAAKGLALCGIDERTALVRSADGAWSVRGAGSVTVFCDSAAADLTALPG